MKMMIKGDNVMYKTQIEKLIKGLVKKHIKFDLVPLWDGWQVRTDEWDAVCHSYSYGHEEGLLEIMGSIVSVDDDTVEGWLTAKDILARL